MRMMYAQEAMSLYPGFAQNKPGLRIFCSLRSHPDKLWCKAQGYTVWGATARGRCLADGKGFPPRVGLEEARETQCRGELPAACLRAEAATSSSHTARPAAIRAVTGQKSAQAIVVVRYFTRVADHEGPNMRSRAEQWVTRYLTIKSERACRVRHRPMLPLLRSPAQREYKNRYRLISSGTPIHTSQQ